MKELFTNLYAYRELLKSNVKKEIRGKYKGAWLGIAWSLLNPLLLISVYSLIFPIILKVKVEHYAIYLCVALLPWSFFTSTITQGAFSVIANGNIIKKVYFPREILPLSVVVSGTVNFLLTCIVMLAFLIFSGIGLSIHALWFPVILFLEFLLILGTTFIVAGITVYMRDLEHIISLGLMLMFYATPIAYSLDGMPAHYVKILMLNPMTSVVTAFRDILFYQKTPNLQIIGILYIISIVMFLIGYKIFKNLEKGFAEEF